jgi:alkanesulfonate monooxygenase SsuD/methylene tetrahydromethanopterin reductase-like flavin-dependent oxidoreductase (luciferase family)
VKFSLMYELQKQRPWLSEDNREVYKESIEQITYADRAGYHAAWVVEHHFLPEFSHSPRPEIFLGHIAALTKNLRIGHGVVVLPIQHPVRVAEGIATLDILSDGRVEFGTGRGLSPLEMRSFGVDPANTREMWEESIGMMAKIWKSELFEHNGKYWQVPPRTVIPKPVQNPHPPMWMAGTQPDSFRIAGEKGLGIIALNAGPPERLGRAFQVYRDAIKRAEPVGDFVNEKAATMVMAHCGDDDAEAQAIGATAAKWYLGIGRRYSRDFSGADEGQWGSYDPDKVPESYRWYSETAKRGGDLKSKLAEMSAEEMAEHSVVIAGNPERCRKIVQQYVDAGTDEILLLMQMGTIPHEKIMRSLELFATEVMPHFQEAKQPSAAVSGARV